MSNLDEKVAVLVFGWKFIKDLGGGYWKLPDGSYASGPPLYSTDPKYFIPIMEALGKMGNHVFVRYDPLRKSKNWTIMIGIIGESSRKDTDDVTLTLCEEIVACLKENE